ncbi:hypothetical protein KC19_11G072500 [Ceratodon purpureus]|uniref:Uncharacterized protein n=1 Tax=Ceratodon purpureus TaxID=3225 RepID=A0A8T0GBF2_CERPU|nr:hypothetical protein KC19_11G072400 [Ceratodon purpureus]KAG0556697.1 hypothetical protein KC19_11G072500 [Ceratodon purpureus]
MQNHCRANGRSSTRSSFPLSLSPTGRRSIRMVGTSKLHMPLLRPLPSPAVVPGGVIAAHRLHCLLQTWSSYILIYKHTAVQLEENIIYSIIDAYRQTRNLYTGKNGCRP